MLQNLGDIQGGMEVFAFDGERLGIVTDVWLSRRDPDTPDLRAPVTISYPAEGVPTVEHGQADDERPAARQLSPVGIAELEEHADIAPTSRSASYFKLEGEGIAYYVPFGAVASYFPGQSVTLDCLRPECSARYAQPPR
jgi:hypothetical protein